MDIINQQFIVFMGLKVKQELVVKSNEILEHPIYKTSMELKVFSKIILELRKNPEADIFYLNKKELLETFGCDKNSYDELKKVCEGMFRPIDLNKGKGDFHLRAVFIDINANLGCDVSFHVSPLMKPYFLNLSKSFTQYLFENIVRLKSRFSIRIYELLKQHEKLGKRKISLGDLRGFLNIDEHKFERFNDFKRYVLIYAQEELKEKTDIYFEFEEIKHGRKITEINFIIKKNKSVIDVEQEIEQEFVNSSEPQHNECLERLVAMGVTRSTAEYIAAEFDQQRIERAIAYTGSKQQDGGVKNAAAFVVTAIKKDYNDALAEEKRKKAEALRLQKQQEKLKKQWQALKTQYSDWKMHEVETALAAMSTDEQESYQQQFKKTPTFESMLDVFRKNKTIHKRLFLTFMSEHVPLDSFEEWAQKNAVDLSVFSDEVVSD